MNWRILLFIPAVAAGIALFMLQNQLAEGPPEGTGERLPIPVRVATISPETVLVSVPGYGRVQPVRTWEAISQVDGRVVSTFPDLAAGVYVDKGELILQVDPRDYEIARDRAVANLAIAEAELAELNAQEENTAEQIVLERQIEEVAQSERDRQASLVRRGSAAQAALDQAERDLITQQRRVLDLSNELALFPVQRQSAEATLNSRRVDLEEAERNLQNTTILAPFTGQILEESVSEGTYIRTGDELGTLASTDVVEIVAQVQPAAMGEALSLLIPDVDEAIARFNLLETVAAIDALRAASIQATVVLSQGDEHSYPAEIVRLDGQIDDSTGTFGIVVQVRDAATADPMTRRPRLTNGAFVAVHFHADTEDPYVVVPRGAVLEDGSGPFVYVVDSENRLQRRTVTVAGRAAGDMVISEGLAAGDTLALAPPNPAIIGSVVAPVFDDAPTAVAAGAEQQ